MGQAAEQLNTSPLLEEFKAHEHFCKVMLDAYALIDDTGKVIKCNQLFAQLVGVRSRQILKANDIDTVLKLHLNSQEITYKDLLSTSNPTRFDEIGATTATGQDLVLIVGVYPFQSHGKTVGCFMLFRDVTAEVNLQGKYKDKATQSITDSLTGLHNRGYFESYIENQTEAIKLSPENSDQRELSVVMLDIDHFKKINDVYGHQAGDYVLQTVSALLKSLCRKTDVMCRYGGEEFIAILPTTNIGNAIRVASKIRKAVEAAEYTFDSKTINVTISSGVAQFQVNKESIEETVARADEALYHSKEQGRNMVSSHDGSTVESKS